jgi:methionine-S-sulfoxide reductase
MQPQLSQATFAGGCFWCIESAFTHLDGVEKVRSGLTGGHTPNPTYQQIHQRDTGHYEAVRVWFDPDVISYQRLLEIFWMQIDPTDPDGQFADRGSEYRTAIFYHDQDQFKMAEDSIEHLSNSRKFDKPIVTKLLPAHEFYEVEEYHQEYARKHPLRYQLYRQASGRQPYISKMWGKDKLELGVGDIG